MPEDGSLARARVDENDGEPVRRAGHRSRRADVHALSREAVAREPSRRVIPKAADVPGSPSEPGTGDDGSGHLPAGETGELLEPMFRVRGGMCRGDSHVIDAVLAQTDHVERSSVCTRDGERNPHRFQDASRSSSRERRMGITVDLRLSFAYSSGCDRAGRTGWFPPFPPLEVPMLPLTKRQREILDYLNEFIKQHGYAPSLEEIGRRFGLSSLATVHKHLTNLQEKGFIKRAWNRSRSVEMVPTRDGRPRRRAAAARLRRGRPADRGGRLERDDRRARGSGRASATPTCCASAATR